MGPATDKHQAPTHRLKLYVRAVISTSLTMHQVPTKSDHCCYKNSALKLLQSFKSFSSSPWRMGPYHLNGSKHMFHSFTKRDTSPSLQITGPYPEHLVAPKVVNILIQTRSCMISTLQHVFRSNRYWPCILRKSIGTWQKVSRLTLSCLVSAKPSWKGYPQTPQLWNQR